MNKSNYRFPVVSGNVVVRLAVLLTVLLTIIVQMTMPRPVDAVATVPTTMNFQGRLTNNAGNIMADGLYNMRFRIYDASTGGTLKWTELRETTDRVQVTNGLFSVQLGQVTPLDPAIFDDGALYFEIELPTPATATCSTASCASFTEGPMTPRNKLSTSAYAYNSETLDGLDSSQFARTDAANTFTGTQIIRADSTNAFQIQNAAGTNTFMNVDTALSTVTFKSGTDSAVRGSELFTSSYSFTATTNWTTNGLTGSSATITHTPGSSTSILPSPAFTPTVGATYEVKFTLSSTTPETYLNVFLGGVNTGTAASSGTYTALVTPTNTNNLEFGPSSTWDGTISSISIKQITSPTTSVMKFLSSTGATALELRTGTPTYANLFLGTNSGKFNVNGSDNIALGLNSLAENTSGSANISLGSGSLENNTNGSRNIALGLNSMRSNYSGSDNVAIGESAFVGKGTGSYNVGVGSYVGYTTGNTSFSTYLGYYAGSYDGSFASGDDLQNAAAIGSYAISQASNSIILGRVNTETRVGIGTTIPDSLFSVSPVYYPVPANSNIKVSQSGNTVTSSGTTATVFTSAMVGMKLIFANGQSGTITAVNSATSLTLSTSQTVSSSVFRIHTGGLQVAASGDATVKHTSATAFQVQNSAGTNILGVNTSTGKVTMADAEISAGKSLTLVGGNTASRPASPTDGMLYYDTETKQLLVYNGTFPTGKWQADRSTATKIVAANDSLAKDGADYVVSSADETAGNADAQINAAITALPVGGGTVYLMEGTYTIDTTITVNTKVRLVGAGPGTVIKLKNGINAAINAITVGATAHGAEIRDLSLDGNSANNTAGNQYGVNVGANGSATQAGTTVSNVTISSFRTYGLYFSGGMSHKVTNSTIVSNATAGIYLGTASTTITGNTISSNGEGVSVLGSNNTVSNNIMRSNGKGIYVQGGSANSITSNAITGSTTAVNGAAIDMWSAGAHNVISGNTATGGAQYGISLRNSSSHNTITGNSVEGNANSGIYVHSSTYTTVTGNKLYNNAGTGALNHLHITSSTNATVTNNVIFDTAGTGAAISIDNTSTNAYVSGNTYSGTGATTISDTAADTKYVNQLDASGQLINSASGGLVSKLVSGSSNDLFQAQNSSGTALMKVTSTGALQAASFDTATTGALTLGSTNATSIVLSQNTSVAAGKTFTSEGDTTVKLTSASAFQVQNAGGTALLAVDTSASTVTIGSATNGVVMSANGLTLAGTARPTRTIALNPEYSGATFTGTGTGNLTSDFCSASGRLNVNATVCNTAGDEHNYYTWTSTTTGTQAYDIYVRYKMPSDFSSGSLANVYMFGKRAASASDTVTISLYQANGTQCGTSTNVATSGASSAWTETAMAGTLSGCTISAGDMVTFKVSMSVGTNGNAVQAGEIRFDYKSAF